MWPLTPSTLKRLQSRLSLVEHELLDQKRLEQQHREEMEVASVRASNSLRKIEALQNEINGLAARNEP